MTLANIQRWLVDDDQLETTERALRHAGAEGFELFVLWTGRVEANDFRVRHVHVPRQASFQEEEGLHVRVDGDELHKLNVWLYEHREILGIQVHTHPKRAYHSDTDDTFPMVTTLGGLSVVAPYFCKEPLLSEGTAVYRLGKDGWTAIADWRQQVLTLAKADDAG